MPRTVRFLLIASVGGVLFIVEWPGIVSWVASMRYCVHVNGILFMRPLSSSSFSKVVPAVRRGFSRRLGRGGSFARTEEVGAPAVFAASWLLATHRVCYYSLSIREREGRCESGIHSRACGDRPRCSLDLHFAFRGCGAVCRLSKAVECARICGWHAQECSGGDRRHIGEVFGVDVVWRGLHIWAREDTVIHPPSVRAE